MSNFIEQKYFIFDDFLNPSELQKINEEVNQLFTEGKFQRAQVGSKSEKKLQDDIRQDLIYWTDPEIILSKLKSLQNELNEELFMGLWSFEGHYAIYPKDTFYKKHVDQFQNNNSRVLSTVLYLNLDWTPDDGGELVMYLKDQEPLKISPQGGRLVCFLSKDLPHEVLPAQKERRSFTGWFKKRAV